jgi:hypothetical protein
MVMDGAITQPQVPVGTFKTFGEYGPPYQVGEALRPVGDGDWMVSITLIESGEVTEYRLSHLLEDPNAV